MKLKCIKNGKEWYNQRVIIIQTLRRDWLMNISEEKKYLYEMMKDITNERRILSEMYMSLKQRMSELDRLQERGFENLDVEGFLDYSKNKSADILKGNLERELRVVEERRSIPVTYQEEKPTVKQSDIQSLKDSDSRVLKKDGRVDNIKVIDFLANHMRMTGNKMNPTQMRKLVLKELDIDLKNTTLNNVVFRLKERHKDIVRVKFGVYGYKKTRERKDESRYSEENKEASETKIDQFKDTSNGSPDNLPKEVGRSPSNKDIHEQQRLLNEDEEAAEKVEDEVNKEE